MSAITKPFVSSSTASNSTTLVPVEQVIGMDKLDTTDPNQPANNKHMIIFNCVDSRSVAREVILYYSTVAVRDTAFTNLKAAICTTV